MLWEDHGGEWPTAADLRVTVPFPAASAVTLWWPTCWGSGGKEFHSPQFYGMKLPVSQNSSQPWFVHLPWESQQVIWLLYPIPSSALSSLSPGKDARLFVFRLSAVQKGLDSRQTGRSRSDCRENKLEKTKGEGSGVT